MNTVSVVMATYNGAEFLDAQLLSLAAQNTLPTELIVSDDGSTDGTPEVVEQFALAAPFPVVLRRNEKRLGYGENFLTATDLATGDYIAFCDQDDVWHPSKLQVALAGLADTGADLLVHPARVIDQAGSFAGRFRQGIGSDAVHAPLRLGPWGVLYGCTMVFRRELLSLVEFSRRGGHTIRVRGFAVPRSLDLLPRHQYGQSCRHG